MRSDPFVRVILIAVVLFGSVLAIYVLRGARHSARRQTGIVVGQAPGILDARGVMTEAVGIETIGGVFTPLIQAGSKAPCSVTEIFSTAADNQTSVMISLYRGTRESVSENTLVGRAVLSDLRLAPRGEPRIVVTLGVNPQGDVVVSALDEATGQRVKVVPGVWPLDEAF